MPHTNIVETKNIIRLVKEKYNFDLSPLVITSLRFKLDNIIAYNHLRDFDHLYEALNGDPDFFDVFLSQIFYSSTELFRDPEMWEILKDKIIPELISNYDRINVLISQSSCGSDLYSMCILMNEMNWFKEIHLHFTWISLKNKNNILKGKIEKNLLEPSAKNIKRVFPEYSYDKYLMQRNREYFFDRQYLRNISHSKHIFSNHEDRNSFQLIICRNRFLFFNLDYQNLMLNKLVQDLEAGGILVIGFKEDISDYESKNKILQEINPLEKIYRKKHT